jgi:hypothetical protein
MQLWSKESGLYLFTIEEFNQLPDGIELESISGSTKYYVKGTDKIDQDTRFGYLAFGVKDPWNHPLKNLFLTFQLKQKY